MSWGSWGPGESSFCYRARLPCPTCRKPNAETPEAEKSFNREVAKGGGWRAGGWNLAPSDVRRVPATRACPVRELVVLIRLVRLELKLDAEDSKFLENSLCIILLFRLHELGGLAKLL